MSYNRKDENNYSLWVTIIILIVGIIIAAIMLYNPKPEEHTIITKYKWGDTEEAR